LEAPDNSSSISTKDHDSVFATDNRNSTSLQQLFRALSSPGNFNMFLLAKDGLKFNFETMRRLRISRKGYYRQLSVLRKAGLIQKFDNAYLHTTFGKIIYQRCILDIPELSSNFRERMKIIDALRHAGALVESDVFGFIEKIASDSFSSIHSSYGGSSPSLSSSKNVKVVWSYDDLTPLLLQYVAACKNEVLIATRISSELLINAILQKTKQGLDVKVLVDSHLIEEYFKTQNLMLENAKDDKNSFERINVVVNPWYPSKDVERRVTELPFGMIIFDDDVIGIELVNSHSPKEFCGGILINDKELCSTMKRFYQRLWNEASACLMVAPTDTLRASNNG
jgi:sugar-specific transcriptional regulator TrmB